MVRHDATSPGGPESAGPKKPKPRKRRYVFYLFYLLILAAGLALVWRLLPREVVDAMKDTYLNPSVEINP